MKSTFIQNTFSHLFISHNPCIFSGILTERPDLVIYGEDVVIVVVGVPDVDVTLSRLSRAL